MKIITIVGARPQFVKAAVFSKAVIDFNKNNFDKIEEVIIHTGQHFDKNMSSVFFDDMSIPKPKYNLQIHSLSHGAMTGQMMEKIEIILLNEKPDWVLVYGDTNSTLAGALAAKKLHIKVAHIEAGLRSFDIKIPEEINRILTDRISDILFCPTQRAVDNLVAEGFENIKAAIVNSGDIMYEATLLFKKFAKKPKQFKVPKKFILTTIHRAENTDDELKLRNIFYALNNISKDISIVLPLHPRTKKILTDIKIPISDNISILEPVGYLEMLYLLDNCCLVMTDSGGLQKEAYFFDKPCITLREETEWVELIDNGFNKLAGADFDKIIQSFNDWKQCNFEINSNILFYGDGHSSKYILNKIINYV